MKLEVRRFLSQPDYTLGTLWKNGQFEQCFTLEDEFRSTKVKHETRIPAGEYPLQLHPRSRFQKKYRSRFGADHVGMVLLVGVPGFRGILFHCGNTDDHTSGCILVGNAADATTESIAASRDAYHRVMLPVIRALDRGETGLCIVRDEP